MEFRFIEYRKEIYLVVGFGYDFTHIDDMCFVAVLLDKSTKSLTRACLSLNTVKIPMSRATEITDKKRLMILMVLYG